MLKQIIEEAIRKTEAAKEQKEREIKDRVTREKIIPYNAEIDKARNEAISQLQGTLDRDIVALRSKFDNERTKLVEAGEKKKAENAKIVIEAEVAAVVAPYNVILNGLHQQLEKVKE